MNTIHTSRCVASDEGRPCNRESVMTRPVALCEVHRIEVALTVVPALLRDQLVAAQTTATTPAPRMDLIATARAAKLDALLDGVHDSVVYFLANGGRVKIGYTTNLRSRLASLALRSDAVLLVLHGGPELERALHARFSAYRNDSTEWFELSPEIFKYIAAPHPAANPSPRRSTVATSSRQVGTDDVLIAKAKGDFSGRVPSFRELMKTYSIGQVKARRIREALQEAQA
ncbi:GIY-YIG nuclease family protein [Streptomyces albogriseolus]|uniref:GIY-YIG nuclease family protein n=1 Tax=Streptomyces albogriseolus TaxID=1887 RepID=UPI003460FC3F